MRQAEPWTAGPEHIQQAIDDLPQIDGAWPPAGFGRRQQRCEQCPLLFGEIGGVGFACHAYAYTTPFSHTFLDLDLYSTLFKASI